MKKARICPACLGTGKVPDHAAIGRTLRSCRKVQLRVLAERMGISAAHLCLLEQGKRAWNLDLYERYQDHNHL